MGAYGTRTIRVLHFSPVNISEIEEQKDRGGGPSCQFAREPYLNVGTTEGLSGPPL